MQRLSRFDRLISSNLLEAELRAALAREAVADERARIAREMHDAVAHSVSLMVLQAGAAEQVLTSRPERARDPEAHSVAEWSARANRKPIRDVVRRVS